MPPRAGPRPVREGRQPSNADTDTGFCMWPVWTGCEYPIIVLVKVAVPNVTTFQPVTAAGLLLPPVVAAAVVAGFRTAPVPDGRCIPFPAAERLGRVPVREVCGVRGRGIQIRLACRWYPGSGTPGAADWLVVDPSARSGWLPGAAVAVSKSPLAEDLAARCSESPDRLRSPETP